MLGGAKITDTVMESAREMKELAMEKKHYHKYYVEGVEVIIGGGICHDGKHINCQTIFGYE